MTVGAKSLFFFAVLACWLAGARIGQAAGNVQDHEGIFFGLVDSIDFLGHPLNTTASFSFTGGYTATSLLWSGTLTDPGTGTWASDARVFASGPIGAGFDINHSNVSTYAGTIDTAGVYEFPTPIDPAGNWDFEWYESFEDAPNAFDQYHDSLFYRLVSDSDSPEALGDLQSGSPLASDGEFAAGGLLDSYTFSIASPGSIDIATSADDGRLPFNADTEIGLFDSAGKLIAFNDNNGFNNFSEISGLVVDSGDYTLVVGSSNSNFESIGIGGDISALTGGSTLGNYALSLDFLGAPIPEPSSTCLILCATLGLVARRKRG